MRIFVKLWGTKTEIEIDFNDSGDICQIHHKSNFVKYISWQNSFDSDFEVTVISDFGEHVLILSPEIGEGGIKVFMCVQHCKTRPQRLLTW